MAFWSRSALNSLHPDYTGQYCNLSLFLSGTRFIINQRTLLSLNRCASHNRGLLFFSRVETSTQVERSVTSSPKMAVLDAPQAMYGGMSSQYLNPYTRGYYREYEQDTLTRLNLHQRLQQASPDYAVKEELTTAFKPYSPAGQENLSVQINQSAKVTAILALVNRRRRSRGDRGGVIPPSPPSVIVFLIRLPLGNE